VGPAACERRRFGARRSDAPPVRPATNLLCLGHTGQPRRGGGGGGGGGCGIRALAQFDREGRFRGYLGVLQADRASADAASAPGSPTAASAARVAAAPATDTLAAEQASFTYTVTHDLRAPIRVVEGFTRIVKEDYGNVLDRVGLDHLDRVLGAAARMNSMIDALLALSKLSQQPLSRQPVNLTRLAEYIIDDLRRTSPERAVRVTIEPALSVIGDPTLLRMALENLLGNAWKYTGKARDAQIWFQRDPSTPGIGFQVRDNGAGFDMRFADRLFGVFQRLHSASDFPGTGVGLASVQRIVRRHGGEIWAESAVGRGTIFRFTLAPAARAEALIEDPLALLAAERTSIDSRLRGSGSSLPSGSLPAPAAAAVSASLSTSSLTSSLVSTAPDKVLDRTH
jgi:signal transduction histidine kinase